MAEYSTHDGRSGGSTPPGPIATANGCGRCSVKTPFVSLSSCSIEAASKVREQRNIVILKKLV
jgi:hypothetical protein